MRLRLQRLEDFHIAHFDLFIKLRMLSKLAPVRLGLLNRILHIHIISTLSLPPLTAHGLRACRKKVVEEEGIANSIANAKAVTDAESLDAPTLRFSKG